jgi:hypothetical protein
MLALHAARMREINAYRSITGKHLVKHLLERMTGKGGYYYVGFYKGDKL